MIQTKIKVNNLDVVASGSLVSFEKSTVELSLVGDDEFLNLELIFDKNEHANSSIKVNLQNTSRMQMILYNFDRSLGVGM